jgi:hypothetical protein
MGEGLLKSVEESLKKRMANPIYGTFIISWAVFHWNFIYSIFFLDQKLILESTGLLKNEYLTYKFFNPCDPLFYICFITPFFLTYFIIWRFPNWFFLPAVKREEEYECEKEKIRLRAKREVELEKTKLAEQEKLKIQTIAEAAKTKEEVKNINPAIIWDEQYKKFKETNYFGIIERIIESIYKYAGRIRWQRHGEVSETTLSKETLAFYHANDLIDFDINEQKVELTDKGRYFVNKFLSEKKSN